MNTKNAEHIKAESLKWQGLKSEVQKIIVGQDTTIERIFIGLLCNGHILLEGVPGLAKTTLIKAMSQALGLHFSRIQFTPDLLPSDLLGTLIYNQKTGEFVTRKGPIFTNILLADEINRSPAKVQSALLECMQEHQVTIGDTTYKIDPPFLVLATQNPIDQEGTYHLPEAQLDRFLFKLHLTYPSIEEEQQIVHRTTQPAEITTILTHDDIKDSQAAVKMVYVDEKITKYIVNIVHATRFPADFNLPELKDQINYGASPRATLALYRAAQAHAFLKKRHFVVPEDIKTIVCETLRHRIILSYEAEADNVTPDVIVDKIIHTIPAP